VLCYVEEETPSLGSLFVRESASVEAFSAGALSHFLLIIISSIRIVYSFV
jgi:hypothetical protein